MYHRRERKTEDGQSRGLLKCNSRWYVVTPVFETRTVFIFWTVRHFTFTWAIKQSMFTPQHRSAAFGHMSQQRSFIYIYHGPAVKLDQAHQQRFDQSEADCNEAIWCNLVTGHTAVIVGVVYRCPNITKQNNEKIHNAINEVSKGDCIIMGDFNHGNIKWDTLQSTGVEDSTFLCLVQDNFLTQHVL